jgi:hypothetical protein
MLGSGKVICRIQTERSSLGERALWKNAFEVPL